jgi:hypothetical protein
MLKEYVMTSPCSKLFKVDNNTTSNTCESCVAGVQAYTTTPSRSTAPTGSATHPMLIHGTSGRGNHGILDLSSTGSSDTLMGIREWVSHTGFGTETSLGQYWERSVEHTLRDWQTGEWTTVGETNERDNMLEPQ